jgi:hypothetical protein
MSRKEDKSEPLFGFFRALVVDSKDPDGKDKLKVWIPDVMPKIDKTKGVWALPANQAVGGRNTENKFIGQSFKHPKGAWIWVFFEAGNPNRVYYGNALNLENAAALPEVSVGSNPDKKWVLFKSPAGRCIVISDDPDDCRVEITGKKAKLSNPPSGNSDSVYTIDGNQNTILVDERSGNEKILIRTTKGDFVNVNIKDGNLEIKFSGNIILESDNLSVKTTGDMNFKAAGDINFQSMSDINILSSTGNVNSSAMADSNIKSNACIKMQASASISSLAVGKVSSDGAAIVDNGKISQPAMQASTASVLTPKGDR